MKFQLWYKLYDKWLEEEAMILTFCSGISAQTLVQIPSWNTNLSLLIPISRLGNINHTDWLLVSHSSVQFINSVMSSFSIKHNFTFEFCLDSVFPFHNVLIITKVSKFFSIKFIWLRIEDIVQFNFKTFTAIICLLFLFE